MRVHLRRQYPTRPPRKQDTAAPTGVERDGEGSNTLHPTHHILAVDVCACLHQHLGDLETEEGLRVFGEEVERFEAMLGVRAEVVAHDLHPDYATTRYALARPARRDVRDPDV